MSTRLRLSEDELRIVQEYRGKNFKERIGRNKKEDIENKLDSESYTKDYREPFVLSAWNHVDGFMMDIDMYCEHYQLPRNDISSYKLVSHTGKPFYNIVFKENISEESSLFDFDSIIQKHINPVLLVSIPKETKKDFDRLVYTDVHIGMDTNKTNNSMYPILWNRDEVLKTAINMIECTLLERESPILFIDELGDLLDGYNAKTTRGGHDLPQNMTNEDIFDCALEFKMLIIDSLAPYYDKIICNNICNDNHAGSFGYFVNSAFKGIVERKYDNIEVTNHRKFINHYYVDKMCFIITHGKDDISLKFGFKPQVDVAQISKIDHYCKQNDIYKNAELIVFSKGDSHQTLFDMCSSDDFYYFNYPALSPSSQWVQNNFKSGRRGFVNESYCRNKCYIKTHFINKK